MLKRTLQLALQTKAVLSALLTATAAQSCNVFSNRVRTYCDSGVDCPARYAANRTSYASEEAHFGATPTTSWGKPAFQHKML